MNNQINKAAMPDRAAKIYKSAYDKAISVYGEALADSIALLAVSSEYIQLNNHWIAKSLDNYKVLDTMYITKVSYKDGRMIWQATASDTNKDSFQERMSVELYKSFIKNIDGHEYVSLAHYPSMDGAAEFGKVELVYIDGEKLKSKGTFNNDDKGIVAYNAIRRDRRENTPEDNRIRISIGFWDYGHKHGDVGEWNMKSNAQCPMCIAGIKDKVYVEGKLDHLALTRIPALKSTSIEVI